MSWSATDRFGADSAPGALGFVQDFLMTGAAGTPRQSDLLADPSSAQAWADEARAALDVDGSTSSTPWRLGAEDADALRGFRTSLVAAIERRDGLTTGDVPTSTSAATVRLGADGRVVLEPTESGAAGITARLLLAVRDAELGGTWRRLKVCRNDRCRGVFYDRSNNNSRVWHDVRTCGNIENLRASRARRKASVTN